MAIRLPRSRVLAFLALPPDAPVRIHTLQHPDAVAAAMTRGYLTCDAEHALDPEFDQDTDGRPIGVARAYTWMRDRMAERMPGFSGDLPVFAWLKRPSAKPLPADFGPTMRITALVPRRRVLASWQDGFLTIAAGSPYAPPRARRHACPDAAAIQSSWLRLPDVSDPVFWRCARRSDDDLQLCVDRIHADEIVSVRAVPLRPAHRAEAAQD